MAEGSSEIKLNGLHHLALVCKDMERTVDFYTRVLGLKLKKGFDLPGYGQHFFFDMGNGSELAFFWFNDAEPAQPGVAAVKNIVGSRQGNISSAHGSMNHVAFSVAADDIAAYREQLIARGVDCTPIVPHDDVVTGADASYPEAQKSHGYSRSTSRSRRHYAGILRRPAAGHGHADLPVNAQGLKADGSKISGF